MRRNNLLDSAAQRLCDSTAHHHAHEQLGMQAQSHLQTMGVAVPCQNESATSCMGRLAAAHHIDSIFCAFSQPPRTNVRNQHRHSLPASRLAWMKGPTLSRKRAWATKASAATRGCHLVDLLTPKSTLAPISRVGASKRGSLPNGALCQNMLLVLL